MRAQTSVKVKRQAKVKAKAKTVTRPKGKGKVHDKDIAQESISSTGGSYVCEIDGQKFGRPYDLERHKETT